jgi:hypothetical protein
MKYTPDETMKRTLRKVKTVDRALEMTLDANLSGPAVMQFCRDVQLYNMHEALMYLEGYVPSETAWHEILHQVRLLHL